MNKNVLVEESPSTWYTGNMNGEMNRHLWRR
nr:MAG TPA: hypothetical protein [Inoviridae sp.]